MPMTTRRKTLLALLALTLVMGLSLLLRWPGAPLSSSPGAEGPPRTGKPDESSVSSPQNLGSQAPLQPDDPSADTTPSSGSNAGARISTGAQPPAPPDTKAQPTSGKAGSAAASTVPTPPAIASSAAAVPQPAVATAAAPPPVIPIKAVNVPSSGGRAGAAELKIFAAIPAIQRDITQILSLRWDMTDKAIEAEVAQLVGETQKARRLAAWERAKKLGFPTEGKTQGGGSFVLQDFDETGRPQYHATRNANAAISTAVHEVRDADPFYVNGSGMTVGLWELGSPLTTHQEFGFGRITLKEASPPAIDGHATHVAGTLAAGGYYDINVKGMAPGALLDAYSATDDLREMTLAGAATATEAAEGKLLISNHSYGPNPGWKIDNQGNFIWRGLYTPDADNSDDIDPVFGRYGAEAAQVDGLLLNKAFYLPFFAAGNDRDNGPPATGGPWYLHNTSGTPGYYVPGRDPQGDGQYAGGYDTLSGGGTLSKNAMTVGAVKDAAAVGVRVPLLGYMTDFSSWGPADDGRIKPDIVANGQGVLSTGSASDTATATLSGTSMASPNAAGSALLLQQIYQGANGGQAMRASMLKGLIIHTADDLGNTGPDYRFGWGLMNTKAAADLIQPADLEHYRILADEQVTSAALVFRTKVFPAGGTTPLRATICWTDQAGTARTAHDDRAPVLVNDLNLKVTPMGFTDYQPYVMPFVTGGFQAADRNAAATNGVNTTDTVEQVFVAAPDTGPHVVEVSIPAAPQDGSQVFSLIVTGIVPPPDIEVLAENTALADGQGYVSMGCAKPGEPVTRIFTIKNTGPHPLDLHSITLDGPQAAEYSRTPAGLSTLAQNQTTTFTVTFNPAAGTEPYREAALHIASTDPDEDPFDITLRGLTPTGTGGRLWTQDNTEFYSIANRSAVSPRAMAVDGLGDVFVLYDFMQVQGAPPQLRLEKRSGSDGALLWAYETSIITGPPIYSVGGIQPQQLPVFLRLDFEGNAIIGGNCSKSKTSADEEVVTVAAIWFCSKINGGTGAEMWGYEDQSHSYRYPPEDPLAEAGFVGYTGWLHGLEVDSTGNVALLGHVVQGVESMDTATVRYSLEKLASSNGHPVWSAASPALESAWLYEEASGFGGVFARFIDPMQLKAAGNGDFIVAASEAGSLEFGEDNHHIRVWRHAGGSGAVLWNQALLMQPPGTTGEYDGTQLADLELDGAGRVVISAWRWEYNVPDSSTLHVLSLNGSTGILAWQNSRQGTNHFYGYMRDNDAGRFLSRVLSAGAESVLVHELTSPPDDGSGSTKYQRLLTKLGDADGSQAWSKPFDLVTPTLSVPRPLLLHLGSQPLYAKVDLPGNLYHTNLTLHSASNGDEIWAQCFDGYAVVSANDSYGNVFVAGDLLEPVPGEPNTTRTLVRVTKFASPNTVPVLGADQPAVAVSEGAPAGMTGTFADDNGNSTVTLTASRGTVVKNDATGTWTWSLPNPDGPSDSGPVTITANDSVNLPVTTAFQLTVENIIAEFEAGPDITLLPPPAAAFSRTITIDDPGPDTWSGTVDYGDGSPEQPLVINQAARSFTLSHTYAAAGSYNVFITLADDDTEFLNSTNDGFDVTVPDEFDIATWRLQHFGSPDNSGDGADTADPDHDGIANLAEYAFQLDPNQSSADDLPQPSFTDAGGGFSEAARAADASSGGGVHFTISFTQPAGVTGITYGAEWSASLAPSSWTAVPDTGSGATHTFSVPVGTNTRLFMRLTASSP